ncbi:MAG: YbaK/EbsC family protein [Candidatus Bathyarchaeia archaeon]
MNWVEKTKSLIERGGIEAQLIEHKEWGKDSRVVSAALKVPLSHVLKAVVCFSSNDPVLALICGDDRLDLARLSSVTHATVRLAKTKEVEKLGFSIGGVPAIGSGLKTYLDRKVLERSYVVGSAGSPYLGVKLKPSDLARLNDATVADLSERNEP